MAWSTIATPVPLSSTNTTSATSGGMNIAKASSGCNANAQPEGLAQGRYGE